jgi:hypothetical protein
MVTLIPTSGTPAEMAKSQRASLVKLGVICSPLAASKDGGQAWFKTELKFSPGKTRKGRIVFQLAKDRTEYTVALYASWNPKSDKAMLAATDKIAASVTVK